MRDDRDGSVLRRLGRDAWALVGILLVAAFVFWLLGQIRLVVVPVLLALFPAAVLVPVERRLEARGVNPSLATTLTFVLALVVLVGAGALIAGRVAGQIDELSTALQDGYERLRSQLERGAFGLPPVDLADLTQRAREAAQGGAVTDRALDAVTATAQILTQAVLLIVTLFFYLRDGERIGRWLRDLFPRRLRDDVEEIGGRVWETVGGYIRGQTLIALVDAVLIGIGLVVLGVPLASALGFLVFVGAYVPVVGALLSGSVAVLVALTVSFPTALLTLALIVGVQQLEGNVLSPIIMGRTIELHPLAVVLALTVGGLLFGIVGAILSLPIAASVNRAGQYVRQRAAPA